MRYQLALFMVCIAFVVYGCESEWKKSTDSMEQQLFALMDKQEQAWNRGDIDAFMAGYLKSDSLRFASGDNVRYGWRALKERYQNTYPDQEAMGELTFHDRDVTVFERDHALLFGRWKLRRDRDTLTGLYTLVFKRTPEGWKIIHDHTSSE